MNYQFFAPAFGFIPEDKAGLLWESLEGVQVTTAPPHSTGARLASQTRLIKSVRLTSAISTLISSMCRNLTNVEVLMLANVSHKACKITAVANAPPTPQLKVV